MNYYHFDDTLYKNNEIISKHYNSLHKEIIDAYKEITGLSVDDLIYMTQGKDEYIESYEYKYEVNPMGKIVHGITDFSPLIADEYLTEICFNIDNIPKSYMEPGNMIYSHVLLDNKLSNKEKAILFAKAYIGNKEAIDELVNIYKLTEPTTYEYIANSAKIIKQY